MVQTEFFGAGSIDCLKKTIALNNAQKILLVRGGLSYQACGAGDILNSLLKESEVTIFKDFSPTPKVHELLNGYSSMKKDYFDLIIAVGGGSVIDTAKFLKKKYFLDYKKRIPLVAIPTTAGTGSEATHFIVYYQNNEKQSDGLSKITLPEYVILDPTLTLSMSRPLSASSGLDALSQSIESCWSINSTEESKGYARNSIRLLLENLENSTNKNELVAREKVLLAANLSGKAIDLTKTTACHAISYPLTSYFNISHGHAVALTLGEMLVYNSQISSRDCNDKRGVGYVRKNLQEILSLFQVATPALAKLKINNLIANLGLETRLSNLNLIPEDLNFILQKITNSERLDSNPRQLSTNSLREILRNIY